jgi:DNA-binding transcriptional ArsR family regulator
MTKHIDHIHGAYEAQGQLFRAISHPVRLAILEVLRGGEQCVCHLEAHLGLRQAYISQHLMVLREAGLVADRKDGWNVFYRVTHPQIYAALDAAAGVTSARPLAARRATVDCPCPRCTEKSGK